jgi:cytoskeleton protein RodZ
MNGEHDNGADTTQGEVHTPQPGPGSRLAKARAAANLSIEQVAASLNLTIGVVTALERDDAEQLPASVFVRGYIRNYARLVGLRDEELVSQFENTRAPDVPLELRPRPASEAPRMHRGVSARAVMAVLLLVGAGSVAWWWAQGGRIDVAGLTGSAPLAPAAQSSEPAPAFVAPAPPVQVPPPAEPVTPSSAGAPPSAPDALTATESGTTAPSVPVVEPEPAPEPPPPPVPSGHKLSLALSDDVWVEVVDDDGSRLVFDMLRSGTSREVTGEGPFLVLLGKAGAVQVELDGRSVDHSAFENKGIARFVLDDQEGEIVTRAP